MWVNKKKITLLQELVFLHRAHLSKQFHNHLEGHYCSEQTEVGQICPHGHQFPSEVLEHLSLNSSKVQWWSVVLTYCSVAQACTINENRKININYCNGVFWSSPSFPNVCYVEVFPKQSPRQWWCLYKKDWGVHHTFLGVINMAWYLWGS